MADDMQQANNNTADETESQAQTGVQGIGSAPFFLVADVVKAAEYYRDQLGFTELSYYGEPPCFCIALLDRASVMLQQPGQPLSITPNYGKDGHSWDAYVWVRNAAAHYARCQAAGAKIVRELTDAPYGLKEFDVMDLDGYVISFGSELG